MSPLKTSSSRKPPSLNKLVFPGTVWVASDIHLGPHNPATAQAFYRFLEQAARQADALLLCGDIFEAWIGDDLATESPPPWLAEAVQQLRHCASHTSLWLGRGNRDFLIGQALAQHLGARLLPDSVVIETAAGCVLVSHGDEYCTDDLAYQRFRHWVRQPWLQRVFMGLSLKARQALARWARARSRRGNARKMSEIMDVNATSIERTFARHGVALMVHGHTHRPARHEHSVHGKPCLRFVLPDWDAEASPPRGGWLSIDSAGLTLHQNHNHSATTPPSAMRYQANGR